MAIAFSIPIISVQLGVTKIVLYGKWGVDTLENKREFVQLSAQYQLFTSIEDQLESLLSGSYEIIPRILSLSYVNDRSQSSDLTLNLSVSLNWYSKTLTFGSGALQWNTSGIRAQILVVACTQMIQSR